jgi:hypothetical protein
MTAPLAAGRAWRARRKAAIMPKDSRARTRDVRARMAETGQTYTQAAASLAAPPQMNRGLPPSEAVIPLIFAEVMAVGGRAAIAAPDDLAEAAAAVQAALTPMWPHVVPEAARDVLMTCAQIAVSRGVTELPSAVSNVTAATMLELTAGWLAVGSPAPGARFAPPAAFASSAAFDRSEDAATLAAVALLMAVAHPAMPDLDDYDSGRPWTCPECGGDDPQGTYGCECWDPTACSECGANSGSCGCWD